MSNEYYRDAVERIFADMRQHTSELSEQRWQSEDGVLHTGWHLAVEHLSLFDRICGSSVGDVVHWTDVLAERVHWFTRIR